jgi:3-phosphoshikimate 1-carboxyvinyltransferase
MRVSLQRSEVHGAVDAPASKSYTHRAIICAALAEGSSRIRNALLSADTEATMRACRALGADVSGRKEIRIGGTEQLTAPKKPVNCGESASTMRFFIPIAALASGTTVLTAEAGLLKRPMQPVVDALQMLGVQCSSVSGFPPVTVHGGGIKGGTARIRGDVSSQFISGMLFAAPRAEGSVTIEVTTELESRNYVDITLDVLGKFGIGVSESARRFEISPQHYEPCDYTVEGDFSSAAFMLAAGALYGRVRVTGLNAASKQGDTQILGILKKMGARMSESNGAFVTEASALRGVRIDATHIPDLVPILAVLGCFAAGKTTIFNAQRLRIKESDRLAAMCAALRSMGARISETEDGLAIEKSALYGAGISTNDHRIAMACAIAALGAQGNTTIENAECVSKSYPDFFRDLQALGARANA